MYWYRLSFLVFPSSVKGSSFILALVSFDVSTVVSDSFHISLDDLGLLISWVGNFSEELWWEMIFKNANMGTSVVCFYMRVAYYF